MPRGHERRLGLLLLGADGAGEIAGLMMRMRRRRF